MADGTDKKVKDIREMFDAFKLTGGSIRELEDFFAFKINYSRKSVKIDLRYNLLVICENPEESRRFLQTMDRALREIDTSLDPASIEEESDINYIPDLSSPDFESFYGIYGCTGLEGMTDSTEATSDERNENRRKRERKDKFWNGLIESEEQCKLNTVIAAGNNDFKEYLRLDDNKFYRFFAHHIYLRSLTSDEIIDKTYRELGKLGFSTYPDFETEIEKYIDIVYPKADLKDNAFVEDLINRILTKYYTKPTNKKLSSVCVPYYRKPRSYEEITAQLDEMVGLKKVKKEFKKLYELSQDPKQANKRHLHFTFEGNPGTGKTTVAEMTADLLYNMGLIKKNNIVTVSRKDIIGIWVGSSGRNMANKIKEAYGGVLFIDEAYFLISKSDDTKSFEADALTVLIDEMEKNGDKFSVIFAGYKSGIEKLLKSNEGLKSRIGYRFEFEDFTDDELRQMFIDLASKEDMTLNEDAYDALTDRFAYEKANGNFGNARAVANIYQQVKAVCLEKGRKNDRRITEADIRETMPVPMSTDLEDMIGLDSVKSQLDDFEARAHYIKFLRDMKMDDIPAQNMNMVFLGNPGTGKTTVAYRIADCLYHMGLLKTNHLEPVERKTLVSENRGGTALQMDEAIQRALNGVLFIDEAYSLARPNDPNDPGREAIEALLTAMETYKDCLVVIFAGYKKEMQNFLNLNPGLSSRIGFTLVFDDYTPDQLTQMFFNKMDSYGFSVKDKALDKVKTIMEYYVGTENFGNGRFVDHLIDMTINKRGERKYARNNYKTITPRDIPDIREISKGERVLSNEDLPPEVKRRIAIHEVGHAIVSRILDPDHPVYNISINVDADGGLGKTAVDNKDINSTESSLRASLAVCFAGRNAERVMLGEQATGCESDIAHARWQAHQMIYDSAMGDFGVTTEEDLLMEADQRSMQILMEQKAKLNKISRLLCRKEELSGKEFEECFEGKPDKVQG